jgi:hypothetical protein
MNRFEVIQISRGEYAIIDTDVPEGDRPYTLCSGYRGAGASEIVSQHRDTLNSGERKPYRIWYRGIACTAQSWCRW